MSAIVGKSFILGCLSAYISAYSLLIIKIIYNNTI
jgi:hypothetical protein